MQTERGGGKEGRFGDSRKKAENGQSLHWLGRAKTKHERGEKNHEESQAQEKS